MRFLLSTMVLLTAVGVAFAQPQRMTPQERTDQLTKQLSLTKEQQAKVLEVFVKADSSRSKIFAENSGDRDAMRAAMGKVREESDKQLKGILTEEQFTQMQKLRESAPGGGRRRGMAP
jgi:periplasmic protein CpxP/Spy